MKIVPMGSQYDSLFSHRVEVRRIACAAYGIGLDAGMPIYAVPGGEGPKIDHRRVLVGFQWLVEHEPELAASVAFES